MATKLSITLSSKYLWWFYLLAFVGDIALAFVAKILPSSFGLAGLATLSLAALGTIADDFTEQKVPGGLPYWLTYIVLTLGMATIATVGQFTGQTLLTEASILSWIILVLGAIGTDLAQDAGANAPAYVESLIQAGIGGLVTFLTFLANNPMATVGAIIATGIAVIVSFLETTGLLPTPSSGGATPS